MGSGHLENPPPKPERKVVYVNEDVYPWIADIPNKWVGVKEKVICELDDILSLPVNWRKTRLCGTGDQEAGFEPIETDRFINIERKYKLLGRYAGWPDAVSAAYGKHPFLYSDNGIEKAAGLDHFIQILKLRYSQSMSIFSLYKRLSDEGLLDTGHIQRIFDLGSGGWSYAFILPIVFPNFKTAVAVDKGQEREPFEKLWRSVFDLENEQFVLCDRNFFELERSGSDNFLEDNFEKYGKADLAQILMFKPQGIDQSYHKLFYQIGEKLNPGASLLVHIKGEDEYVLENMRQSVKDTEHTELMDWHTDVRPSGEVGPDEVRVFVIKQAELMKLKSVMERSARHTLETLKNPWEAISSYDHLLELEEDNPAYLLSQAKAYLSMLPGNLRLKNKGDLHYHVSGSGDSIKGLFLNTMKVMALDTDNIYQQESDNLLTEFFCKLAIGSLARIYPEQKTAWSFDERRKYVNRLVKPFSGGENYVELFTDIFGMSVQDLSKSALHQEFESVYKNYLADEIKLAEDQELAGEQLNKDLFLSISRITRQHLGEI